MKIQNENLNNEKPLSILSKDQINSTGIDELKIIIDTYRSILNYSHYSIFILGSDGKIIDLNSPAEKLFGYKKEDYLGKTYKFILNPKANKKNDIKDKIIKAYQGENEEIQVMAKKKSGETFPAIFRLTSINYPNKKGVIVFCSDISKKSFMENKLKEFEVTYLDPAEKPDDGNTATENKIRDISQRSEAANQLQKVKEQLQFAIDGSGAGLWDWYIKSGECKFSEQWAGIIGYKLEELLPLSIDTWSKYTHPDDIAKSNLLLDRHFKGEINDYVLEIRMKHKSGHWIWVLDRGRVVEWDKDGLPFRMVGTHIDITPLKTAEKALRRSEEKYRLLVENQTDLVVEVDNNNKFTFVSPSYCTMFGRTEQELLGNSFFPLIHEDDRESTRMEMEKLKSPPFTCRLEQRALTNFGWRWLEWSDRATVDSNNNILSVIGVGRDITDRKNAEKEIEETEENLRAILNTSADIIVLLENDGTIIEANRIFNNLTKFSRENILGSNLFEHFPSDKIGKGKELLREILTLKTPQTLVEFAFNKTWEINIRPIINNLGDVKRITIFAKDITEKYFYEEELKKTNEKLKNLSKHINFVREQERKKISREVHDNLGQKLTALNLEISWIKQNIPEELSAVKNQFTDVMELINQSIIIVQEISTELRPGILDDLGLVNAIQWQCNKVSRKSDLNFNLDLTNEEIDLSDEMKTVLFRVFQETLTNIVRHSHAKNITVNLRLQQNILIFEILDDGVGIPKEKLNDFSSFGIIGMKERIDSINGSIKFSTGKHKGTVVKIKVPLTEAK